MANEEVLLYAYRLLDEATPLKAWHLSVFVFDLEFSYNGNDGVTYDEPINNHVHKTINMGFTNKTKKEFISHVEKELKNEFTNLNYHVLRKNCQHFAQRVLNFLEIEEPIPIEYTVLLEAANVVGTFFDNLV